MNWDQIGIPVPPGPVTQQCNNKNPSWVSGVLPKLDWLKKACPTAYVYQFDDPSSTFACRDIVNNVNQVSYTITFCPGGQTPPPTDTGTIKVVADTTSASQCVNATDTLFVDQNGGQTFTVSNGVSTVVGVGSHLIRLSSNISIPAPNNSGTCTSTLSQTSVNVVKDQTIQVTATYRFESTPPPAGRFSYNVTLGYPFYKVVINSTQSCPDATGKTTCLVENQAVASNMTIAGRNGHLCSLAIQSNGSLVVNPNSSYCYINSSPATGTRPGFIALPGGF